MPIIRITKRGYVGRMSKHQADPAEHDQDAEPTMTAPPEERPDAGASELEPEGRADNPDVIDTDVDQDERRQQHG
ncbi:hypothetical protein [Pseudonocardia sp. MH-G8]|uniref:hypothetical protein n=1 Tax=Pseudonocardia sp. MH-G8 TaxID=1854588 RepID=UPI000BA0C84A|nr:hypothetical protein [Pseudonocardia sp. MH-G8]OZM77173.1 hypothetical protein CFP66_36680 [Pseudonocardia sp. MH-G8]